MTPDESRLLHDVVENGRTLRGDSLQAGLSALRWRRVRRRAFYGTSFVAVLFVVATLVLHREQGRSVAPVIAAVERTIPGTDIRVLNDEQLLDFFKGRPVALVGPPGEQRLIVFRETVTDQSGAQ